MVRIYRGYTLTDPDTAAMFADRKRLFVDLLGWDVPVVGNRYEIDQFDGPAALYLIAREPAAAHVGSLRLLPTESPHILDTLFADLCAGRVPRGSDTLEITRLCLPCRIGAARRLVIRNRLISAMVDLALQAGVRTLTGVVSARFRDQVMAMGWRCELLGPPARRGGETLGAFAIHIDDHTAERLASRGIYTSNAIALPIADAA